MGQPASYISQFKQLKCCVLIPTYNNERTIAEVIESCSTYTDDIIVVNDGSTDATDAILKKFESIHLVAYTPNKGKGNALKAGFKAAEELGFDYAIAIDSDGQHLASDLPQFIEKIKESPNSLIVGERNMDQEHIPGGSTFGHKFSNFWYWAETGTKLPDTQSGYRLYPVKTMNKIWFFTGRYEFEIENIVKASWKGINVTSVPVQVIYQEGEERVTHFRPFDFFRISLLNTYLVTLALLIYHPLRLIKGMTIKNIKRIFKEEVVASKESNFIKALSIGFGVFMGIVPIWGFQFTLAIILAVYFKMNKVLVGLAAQVSVPPLIPFVIYGSYKVGEFFHQSSEPFSFSDDITLSAIHNNFMQYFIGATVLSIVAGIATGVVSYLLLFIFRRKKE